MKKQTALPFALLLTTLLATAPATASDGENDLDERISLELEGADARMVLSSFGDVLEREVELAPEIGGTVSIELHGVRVATAITAVCESVGCTWRLDGETLRIAVDPDAPAGASSGGSEETGGLDALEQRIDMELEGAPVAQVLRSFGQALGTPVELAEGIDGEVTVQLHDVSIREALDAVCRIHRCRWRIAEGVEGPVLRIAPAR